MSIKSKFYAKLLLALILKAQRRQSSCQSFFHFWVLCVQKLFIERWWNWPLAATSDPISRHPGWGMEETAQCRSCELSQKKSGFQLGFREVYSETCKDEENQIFCLSPGRVTSDAEEVILYIFLLQLNQIVLDDKQDCNLAFKKAKSAKFCLFWKCLQEIKWFGNLAIFGLFDSSMLS